MSEDMHTRLSRLEWRQDALEDSQRRQEERMTEMSGQINARFDQVMDAIGSLKDDRARSEGAAEARVQDAKKRQDRLRAISVILGLIGTAIALGWIKSSDGSMLPIDTTSKTPIPVQYCTRDLP